MATRTRSSKKASKSQPLLPLIGAHVASANAAKEATEREAEAIQIFVSSPRTWRKPARVHKAAEELRSLGLTLYVHAPYLINVCSGDKEVRQKSIELLAATLVTSASLGARGVVVHGGQATDQGEGLTRWKQALRVLGDVLIETQVPLLVENTAGGANAAARYPSQLQNILKAGEKLRTAEGGRLVKVCLDTCHAWAAGWTVKGLEAFEDDQVGLVHANGSADGHGSGIDHHTNLCDETNNLPEYYLQAVMRRFPQAAVVVETPGGAEAQLRDVQWLKAMRGDMDGLRG